MGYETKPLLNDVIKANVNTPITVTVQRIGTVKVGQYGPSWPADVLYNASEYTYWINGQDHHDDIQRFITQGVYSVKITMVPDYVNGKTKLRLLVESADSSIMTPTTTPPPKHDERGQNKPLGGSVGRNYEEEARGKCRHAYAVEVFKGLIADKKPLIITPQIAMVIDAWTAYSMNATLPGSTADSTQPLPDSPGDTLSTIPF